MDETGLPPRRRFLNWRVFLLFLLLIGAFAAYARYVSNQRAGNVQVYDNLAVFDARLQSVEKTIVAHQDRLDALEKALTQARSEIAARSSTVAASVTPSTVSPEETVRIAALEKQVASLKSSASPDNTPMFRAIRLLSSLHRLTDKILAGKPFATELTAFEAVASPDESAGTPLGVLAPYADSGIPTDSTLLADFDQASDGMNAAESVPPADAGFWARLKYNLLHIVTVRRIDEAQTGNSPDSIAGRAQAHLERGEIEAAIADVESLPENLRGNFSGWLEDAHRVTEIPALVSQLEEQIMLKSFGAQGTASSEPTPNPGKTPAAPPETPAPPVKADVPVPSQAPPSAEAKPADSNPAQSKPAN